MLPGTYLVPTWYNIANANPIRYRGYYYDNDLGLYYLQSRYYDSNTGRFINADGILNGNGDILGFNLYAYCGNDPVLYSDPNGRGLIGKLLDRAYHNLKYTFSQLVAPIKSITGSVGFGPGIGVGFEGKVKGISVSAEYKDADIASLEFANGTTRGKFSSGESVDFGIEILEYQSFNGSTHYFDNEDCTCGGFFSGSGFFSMRSCPADEIIKENSQILGISTSLYVGFGGEVSLGLDLNAWLTEKHRVEEEYYNYLESWSWDE